MGGLWSWNVTLCVRDKLQSLVIREQVPTGIMGITSNKTFERFFRLVLPMQTFSYLALCDDR